MIRSHPCLDPAFNKASVAILAIAVLVGTALMRPVPALALAGGVGLGLVSATLDTAALRAARDRLRDVGTIGQVTATLLSTVPGRIHLGVVTLVLVAWFVWVPREQKAHLTLLVATAAFVVALSRLRSLPRLWKSVAAQESPPI